MQPKIIFLLLLTSLILACGPDKGQTVATVDSSAPAHVLVETTPARLEQAAFPVLSIGMIQSSNEARPSFKTGGIIARSYVKAGDQVRAGQLLATLHPDEIDAQVQQAREGLEKSKRDLQRARNLYADSVATLEQLQNAQTAEEIAARNLDIASFNRRYSEVHAPISGKILRQLLHEGEVAGPGMPVFAILGNNNQDWVVALQLADRDWSRLQIGDQASVQIDAYPGRSFSGKISKLAAAATPGSGTFEVEVKLSDYPERLAAGLVANAVVTPRKGADQLIIPASALVAPNGRDAYVYTVAEDSTANRVAVQIGELFNDRVVILAGLREGQQVVITGAPYLRPGQPVRVVNNR